MNDAVGNDAFTVEVDVWWHLFNYHKLALCHNLRLLFLRQRYCCQLVKNAEEFWMGNIELHSARSE